MITNLSALDLWAVVHGIAGFVIGYYVGSKKNLGWVLVISAGVLILWEFAEVWAGPGGFGGAESTLNIWFDVVVGMAGALFGWWVVSRG